MADNAATRQARIRAAHLKRAREIAKAARDRLIATGAWDIEEDAEREVRHRSRHDVHIAA